MAMNDDALQDLKQFITTTVSQQTTSLRQDIREDIQTEINKLDEKLSAKIDDLSASVAEAMEKSNEDTDSQLQNHENRITKLEHKIA